MCYPAPIIRWFEEHNCRKFVYSSREAAIDALKTVAILHVPELDTLLLLVVHPYRTTNWFPLRVVFLYLSSFCYYVSI